MNTENVTPELFAALAKAQGEVENASKASTNPHFKSRYADLAEILNTVRPTFTSNGLSIIQSSRYDGVLVSVDTVIAHVGGGFISSSASCVPAKTDGQGIGAATTYLRRYSLAAMAGIAQEDDDGNSASHNKPVPASPFIIAAIKERLVELEVDEPAFLKFLNASSVDSLTADQAKRASISLDKKAKQMDADKAKQDTPKEEPKKPTETAKTVKKVVDELGWDEE